MTVPKNLGEVRDELLNGYELTNGYYLQLQHSTILVLPALIKGELEPFVCVDRALLKKVWERMPKRHARVTEVLLYANVAKNIAFSILLGDEAEPLHILSEEEFAVLNKSEEPFVWTSGPVSKVGGEVMSPFE